MPTAINLDRLPRLPKKEEGVSRQVLATVEALKEKMEENSLTLVQRGWLAQYDEEHGDGELKGRLFEEIITTTTHRRELELVKTSPEVEATRQEGQRLDRVLGTISEVQREATRQTRAVLEEIRHEREIIKEERQEMREFMRQLFIDQRALLELSFKQVAAANITSVEALETLKEGVRAKAEAEAIAIGMQAQAEAAAQAQANHEGRVKEGLRGRLEDTLLLGIANKVGLNVDSLIKPIQAPVAPEHKKE